MCGGEGRVAASLPPCPLYKRAPSVCWGVIILPRPHLRNGANTHGDKPMEEDSVTDGHRSGTAGALLSGAQTIQTLQTEATASRDPTGPVPISE